MTLPPETQKAAPTWKSSFTVPPTKSLTTLQNIVAAEAKIYFFAAFGCEENFPVRYAYPHTLANDTSTLHTYGFSFIPNILSKVSHSVLEIHLMI